MPKNTVITISGVPGTGTTTIAKLLSKQLDLPLVYTGETFRKLAKEHKMNLGDFSELAKSNPEIDHELDARQLKEAKRGNIILEGRLAGWLTNTNNIDSFKILLTADLDTRITRIMDRENKSFDKVQQEIVAREECELERYKKLYDVNYLDDAHYDFILDTSNLTPDQIVIKIIDGINND